MANKLDQFFSLTRDEFLAMARDHDLMRCSPLESEDEVRPRLSCLTDVQVEYLRVCYHLASRPIPDDFLLVLVRSPSYSIRMNALAALTDQGCVSPALRSIVEQITIESRMPMERSLAMQVLSNTMSK